MRTWFKKSIFVLILLTLGLGTRFLWISHPGDVVWDEQHFGRFTKGYIEHKYFFDIHPPLGKFILLAALKVSHANPGDFDFAIGTKYPASYPYTATRAVPALAGGLLPIIIYFFARALTFSRRSSFFAGMLVVFDNAIFAESHYALIDVFVMVFGLLGLLAFVRHRNALQFSRTWWLLLFTTAVLGALAASVKWTGIGALTVVGIATIIETFEKKSWKVFVGRAVVLGTVLVAVYVPFFWLHFRLLQNSGPGDAFMSERFRAGLNGTAESKDPKLGSLGFFEKFAELNKKMFLVNAGQNLTHPDSSRFYEWPVGQKRIYFWVNGSDGKERIFLIANPVVWLFGTGMFVAGMVTLALKRRKLRDLLRQNPIEWRRRIFALEFLCLVYFANWLPFAAVSRAMFLYHYFSSLVASLLLGTLFLFEVVPALYGSTSPHDAPRDAPYLFWTLLGLAGLVFVLFSPLSYGYKTFFG